MIKGMSFAPWGLGFTSTVITLSDSGDEEAVMGLGESGFPEVSFERGLKRKGLGRKRLNLGPVRLNLDPEGDDRREETGRRAAVGMEEERDRRWWKERREKEVVAAAVVEVAADGE